MNAVEFLRALGSQPRTHFFVVTPDQGGLLLLVPKILRKVAAELDIDVRQGANLGVNAARELAAEARKAPRAGSERTHLVIYDAEKMTPEAASALLLAVEDTVRARFVFMGRDVQETLASRCVQVRLPFLSRKAVLGNLQALHLDARTADEKNLWDGTLGGTLQRVRESGTRARILKAAESPETLGDLLHLATEPGFVRVIGELATPREVSFLERDDSLDRRRLVAALVSSRGSTG